MLFCLLFYVFKVLYTKKFKKLFVKVVLDYNLKCKMNIHESIVI